MKNGRFEVGDTVIGNSKANDRYSITKCGWKGRVISTTDDYDLKSYGDTIEVQELDRDITFRVNHHCFDLLDPDSQKRSECGVFISNVALPECCAVCFAYNECGCSFISLDKSVDIWKSRASNCPITPCGKGKKV